MNVIAPTRSELLINSNGSGSLKFMSFLEELSFQVNGTQQLSEEQLLRAITSTNMVLALLNELRDEMVPPLSFPIVELENQVKDLEERLLSVQVVVDVMRIAKDSNFLTAVKDDTNPVLGGSLNANSNKIINLAAPTLLNDATTKIYVDTADALKLNLTGGTLSGVLVASGGVELGGTGSTHLLDDYEEGTFVPGLTIASGSVTIGSNNTLSYTKIGNLVHVRGILGLSAISTPVGTVRLTGLPFPCANFIDRSESPGFYVHLTSLASSIHVCQGRILGGATQVDLVEFTGTTVADNLGNKLASNTNFTFDFSYPAA